MIQAMNPVEGDLYAELRRLAARRLRGERAGHTLSPTALVHEAYLRLAGQATVVDRGQLLATAAIMMRRILVSHARARGAQKRGDGERAVTLDDAIHAPAAGAELALDDVIALDELLGRLEAVQPRQARGVTLRVFGGLTDGEIADALGVSTPTVRRDWRMARAWLIKELEARA
jgi:RNA polymerase sigma factor (TIGR02999 family)